jgi:multidrug efflux system membrane fusion protein
MHGFTGRLSAAGLTALILLLLALSACSQQKSAPPKQAVPVTVAIVVQKAIPFEIQAIGNIEAFSNVAVKAQVTGQLAGIHFKEGQFVKKGAILFTINARQQQAAVHQAEAALARDKAQVDNAREDERRYADLVKKGYVSRQQYDQVRTTAAALEATVAASQATLDAAREQLSYYFIYSPIDGRMGDILVNEGNMIKANDDNKSLATIRQIEPIYVSFSVPERDLAAIKQYMAQKQLAVDVFLDKNDSKPAERGVLSFIDNAVDSATGTIKLKGTLKNSGHKLWPGQFVTVLLTLFMQNDAIVVPSAAVQTGQTGTYVFVVKQDNSVDTRPIAVARIYGDTSVIEKGLNPGEQVVTDGQLRLVPGAKISIKENQPADRNKAAETKQSPEQKGPEQKSKE